MREIKRLFAFVLVAALAGPGLAAAQSNEEKRNQERAKRAEEKALQEAETQMREAQEQMREAERQFQRAAREYARQRSDATRELVREKAESIRERDLLERELARETARGRVVMFSDDARLGILIGSTKDDGSSSRGVVIQGLTPGGPAEEAGLKSGDVITKINGRELVVSGGDRSKEDSPSARLSEAVAGLEDGEEVKVEYLRDGSAKQATVTARRLYGPRFKVMPAPMLAPKISIDIPEIEMEIPAIEVADIAMAFSSGFHDLELLTLNPELGTYFGAEEGVLVVKTPKSDGLPLKAGDVIVRIGNRVPRSPTQTLRILRSYDEGEEVSMEILRERRSMTLSVAMPKRSSGWSFRSAPPAPPARPAVPAKPAAPAPPAKSEAPASGYHDYL